MFDFKVRPDNAEPFEVTATSRDVTAWERGVGLPGRPASAGRSLGGIEKNPRLVDLEELAYVASIRHGLYEGKLASFQDTCDFEVVPPGEGDDEVDLGPTRTDR